MLRPFAVLLSTLVAVSALHAQVATVGERVRITTPSQRGPFRYVGSVSDVSRDSLTVQSPDVGTRTIAVADITTLEVSRGVRGNGKRGMVYGGLIGVGAGIAVGAATYRKPDCSGSFLCPSGRGLDMTAGALVGGVVGLTVGGLWGVSHPSDHWTRRMLNDVGFSPLARGRGVAISARF